jgi:hypothetical protein
LAASRSGSVFRHCKRAHRRQIMTGKTTATSRWALSRRQENIGRVGISLECQLARSCLRALLACGRRWRSRAHLAVAGCSRTRPAKNRSLAPAASMTC